MFNRFFFSFESNSDKYRKVLTIRKGCIIWLLTNNIFFVTKILETQIRFFYEKMDNPKIIENIENIEIIENIENIENIEKKTNIIFGRKFI